MKQAQITLSGIKASKLDSHSEINGRAAKKHDCLTTIENHSLAVPFLVNHGGGSYLTSTSTEPIIPAGLAK